MHTICSDGERDVDAVIDYDWYAMFLTYSFGLASDSEELYMDFEGCGGKISVRSRDAMKGSVH